MQDISDSCRLFLYMILTIKISPPFVTHFISNMYIIAMKDRSLHLYRRVQHITCDAYIIQVNKYWNNYLQMT